jgi:hypothetical protein
MFRKRRPVVSGWAHVPAVKAYTFRHAPLPELPDAFAGYGAA